MFSSGCSEVVSSLLLRLIRFVDASIPFEDLSGVPKGVPKVAWVLFIIGEGSTLTLGLKISAMFSSFVPPRLQLLFFVGLIPFCVQRVPSYSRYPCSSWSCHIVSQGSLCKQWGPCKGWHQSLWEQVFRARSAINRESSQPNLHGRVSGYENNTEVRYLVKL